MAEQGNLYQKLIVTAKELLDRGEVLPGTIHELAHIAEVDPDAAQHCFASMEDLDEGLLYHAVVLLNDSLRKGMIGSASRRPDMQLRSLARSYSEWASDNPTLFRLLTQGLNGTFADDSALHRFTLSMRDLFERKFHEMCDLGILDPKTDVPKLILMLHCLVRGGNIVIIERATDPWLQQDERAAAMMAADIFDDFLDCVMSAHAPRAKIMATETTMN
ncbi:TetR/AcrR family transcriptional regulator [Paracoccus laeviglucosivorans]|uniref:Tetracyclin repressor-like C-terminal domain-containing protein n=1 Tax=Paracoccus laeviglucosivorans TaxID=1197861 RepID=A0A521BUH6_9RHOB|nr:hypothetical protein [Paracoccus laeviglucosivorans]SMO50331.1 hypothetical protein SAMN06265221_103103 [Paracoccus laeviglucosivorans]